jgi:DNA polymerase-3 subunit epsilon
VVKLTGINSNMLKNAPKFYEVAKRIVEITEDCIIVAHNAEFDYRILRTEFKRLGFPYKRKTLCTVELSQQLMPEQESYSLGKLTRALGIPVSDRHRANGDAMATVKLFKLLLNKDSDKHIITDSVKVHVATKMNDNHIQIIEDLPAITGVYYLHDEEAQIIYIGKSKNIKHRVNQHLTNTSSKSKKLQLLVKSVSYEATGSELVALLKESEEIKRIKPKFNRALKRKRFTHGLYSFTDEDGYLNLRYEKILPQKTYITTFANWQSAKSFMDKMLEKYTLCQKLTGLSSTKSNCFNYTIKNCNGACLQEESAIDYNKRVQEFIDHNSYSDRNMAIVDQGRAIDERSVIYIKDGVFKGLGFTELNYQINNSSVLENIISPMENNRDTQHIIQSYLRKHSRVKIISIPTLN